MKKFGMSFRWKPVLMVVLLVTAGWMPVAAERTDVGFQPFDFKFEGGTIEEFVTKLNLAIPGMNVIAQEHTNELLVPKFQAKQVNIEELGRILSQLAEVRCNWVGHGIMVIEGPSRRVGLVSRTPEPKLHLFMYPLMPLIVDRSSQDVILLINQACEMMQVTPPAFQIHEETLMLMASVTSEQLTIIEQVIGALKPATQIGEVHKLEEELNAVKAERDALQKELTEAVKASRSSK